MGNAYIPWSQEHANYGEVYFSGSGRGILWGTSAD